MLQPNMPFANHLLMLAFIIQSNHVVTRRKLSNIWATWASGGSYPAQWHDGGWWRDQRNTHLMEEIATRQRLRRREAESGVKSEPGRKFSDVGGPYMPVSQKHELECLRSRTIVALTLGCTVASIAFAFRFNRSFCFTWWIMTNYSRIIVQCDFLLPCNLPSPASHPKVKVLQWASR